MKAVELTSSISSIFSSSNISSSRGNDSCYVVGDETLSNNLTPYNYITLFTEDIQYRTTMLILVRLLY